MKQKTTWKHYLLIGISLIVYSSLIMSCGKTRIEYLLKTSYWYKNLTSEKVEIKLYNEHGENHQNYFILPGEELLFVSEADGPKNGIVPPFYTTSTPPSFYITSKVTLKFTESNRCIENYPKLLDEKQYDNFDENMYNKSDNLLNYTIDEGDYNLAEVCE